MRLHPTVAVFAMLLSLISAAQSEEWLRDDMSDDALYLLRTSNLSVEKANAAQLPGSIGGSTQWIASKGDGPAYVVYFVPGRIHEVEIDTHRLAGAAGDFNVAVSTDGRLYQPLNTGSMLLDSAFGWDYRLVSTDQVPENATHLLVQFPDAASAHRLSEVWIRFSWDDALAAPFLPPPLSAAPPAGGEFEAQSDAELERMIAAISLARPPVPVPEIPRHEEVRSGGFETAVPVGNQAPNPSLPATEIEAPAPTDPPMVTLWLPDAQKTEAEGETDTSPGIKIDIDAPEEDPATDPKPDDKNPAGLITGPDDTPGKTQPDDPEDAGTTAPPSDLPAVEALIEPTPADAVSLDSPEAPQIEIRLEPYEPVGEEEVSPRPIVLPPFFLAVPGGSQATQEAVSDSTETQSTAPGQHDQPEVSGTSVALALSDPTGSATILTTAGPAQPDEDVRPPVGEEAELPVRPKRIGPRSKIR